ncbi:MAG: hypothetical protein P1U34_05775 [Coxiellaceae bacterium]|nr:hypothetical protein [Coxiellaceae bacterium]
MNRSTYNKYVSYLSYYEDEMHIPSAAEDLVTLLNKYNQAGWFSNRHHDKSCRALSSLLSSLIQQGSIHTPNTEQCINLINTHLAKDEQGQDMAISKDGDLAYLLAIWFTLNQLDTAQLEQRFQHIEFHKLTPSEQEIQRVIAEDTRESKTTPLNITSSNQSESSNSPRRPTRGSSVNAEELISFGIISEKAGDALRQAEKQELETTAKAAEDSCNQAGFSADDLPLKF